MKLLVCGSRDMNGPASLKLVINAIKELNPTEIIHGGAKGADSIGHDASTALGLPVTVFRADWDKYGKAAGPIRNQKMLDEKPDIVLAFYPEAGITKGTKDMVERAKKAGIKVVEVKY